jgi:hypothetical protein
MGEIKLMRKVTRMAEMLGEKDQAVQLLSQEPAAISRVGVWCVCVCVGCLFAIGSVRDDNHPRIWEVNIRVPSVSPHSTKRTTL